MGSTLTANAVPLVPRLTTSSPGAAPTPSAAAMLSPVPGPTGIPAGRPRASAASSRSVPAGSAGPWTRGSRRRAAVSAPTASASRSRRSRPSRGDHQPEPDASPRSVTRFPVSRRLSQSWGNPTAAVRARSSGEVRARWASLAMVNDATRRDPTSRPKSAMALSRSASGAASTLFQSGAGRMTPLSASRVTIPCC